MKVTRPTTLTCKVPSTLQHNSTHGLHPTAATNEHDGGQEMLSSGDGKDGYDQQESWQPGRWKWYKAWTFCNVDLPGLPGLMRRWHGEFLLCWFQYITTVNNIWNLAHQEHIAAAQSLWNHKMGDIPHMLTLNDEPVFYLVCSLLLYFL